MATKKQLANLAKARKVRAANLAKKKVPVKKRKTVAKKVAPKKRITRKVARKSNPSKRVPRTNYVVMVETIKGRGYLSDFPQSGPKFDTEIKNALTFTGHRLATHMQNAIFNLAQTRKIRGIKSVDIKLIGIPTEKK